MNKDELIAEYGKTYFALKKIDKGMPYLFDVVINNMEELYAEINYELTSDRREVAQAKYGDILGKTLKAYLYPQKTPPGQSGNAALAIHDPTCKQAFWWINDYFIKEIVDKPTKL
jgi:hypothetical protein